MSEVSRGDFNAAYTRSPNSRLGLTSIARPRQTPRTEEIELFHCRGCGEVIGVYEPLVAEDGGGVHTTSRAAEPSLKASAAIYYHRECHAAGELPERRTALA